MVRSSSESDSSDSVESLTSDPLTPVIHEECPEDIDYVLKIPDANGKLSKFKYSLHQGVKLPHRPSKLKALMFSQELKPVLKGIIGRKETVKGKEFWVFEGRNF